MFFLKHLFFPGYILSKSWKNKCETVHPATLVLFTCCVAVDCILGEKRIVKHNSEAEKYLEKNLIQKDHINRVWEQNWSLPKNAKNYVVLVKYYLELQQVFPRVPV